MQRLSVNGVAIEDTFAEAFAMPGTALLITADTLRWARQAAVTMTGFATSVIGCGCEAGIDCDVDPSDTLDGRPGVRVLVFAFTADDLQKQIKSRVGQCVLTSPGSACYADWRGEGVPLKLGNQLRYFGDGWQMSKRLGGRRYWRIPVMDGEFVCEDSIGYTPDGVGGGNLLILGTTADKTLAAAEAAVAAMSRVPDVILPFPGGIVRSGSKVGTKYAGMVASTNEAFCPTLRAQTNTSLDPDTGSVLEIVIDGLSFDAVATAMRVGIAALTDLGPHAGLTRISAGNYGGMLGPHHYHLKDLLSGPPAGAAP